MTRDHDPGRSEPEDAHPKPRQGMTRLASPPSRPPLISMVYVLGSGVVASALAGRMVRSGIPVAGLTGLNEKNVERARIHAGVLCTVGEVSPLFDEANVLLFAGGSASKKRFWGLWWGRAACAKTSGFTIRRGSSLRVTCLGVTNLQCGGGNTSPSAFVC